MGYCVLSLILAPVFNQAEDEAIRTHCLSNLKQLGTAQMMYIQDYDEHFPMASQWGDLTEPYLKDRAKYRCPSVSDQGGFGYAMNSEMSQKKFDEIKKPDQTLLLYDSTNLAWNAHDKVASLPDPHRHSDKNNVAYADGHANGVAMP
ncbi:MAG: hypothetical protein KIT45_03195 [Fimbriimonadia bacterium]|nr:hypothetical protein [Fimbriimonadia bacterium]